MVGSVRTQPPVETPCSSRALDRALADLKKAARPRHRALAVWPACAQACLAASSTLRGRRARPSRPASWSAPCPGGGSAHTVNSTSDNENQSTGASFRIVADTADWDRSVGTNTPGQSGDPASPHYQDLFAPWAEGVYFPAAYTRPKVESVTEAKTIMLPSPDAKKM